MDVIDPGRHPRPDLMELPIRLSRDTAAKLLSRYFFEVSPRTLERWPVAWRQLNGRAHAETSDLFAHAEAMLAAAPVVMGGHKTASRQAA
jgi:mannose/cellobiose epimerase-like protein (N-acyl-D-glucosamine 2-epimerase family)